MLKYHNPRVYVGTYGKYNDGSLDGGWVDLDDFSSYDEFMEHCHEMHGDESDPEFMFQDYEDIPGGFAGESWIKPEFWDFMEDDDVEENVRWAVAEEVGADSYFDVKDDLFVFPDCRTMEDVAYAYIDEIGGLEQLGKETLETYFDHEAFGRDVAINDGSSYEEEDGRSIYETYGVSEDDDRALGEELIDEYGMDGVQNLEYYFDYDEFGRALEMEGTFVRYGEGAGPWGMVEIAG